MKKNGVWLRDLMMIWRKEVRVDDLWVVGLDVTSKKEGRKEGMWRGFRVCCRSPRVERKGNDKFKL